MHVIVQPEFLNACRNEILLACTLPPVLSKGGLNICAAEVLTYNTKLIFVMQVRVRACCCSGAVLYRVVLCSRRAWAARQQGSPWPLSGNRGETGGSRQERW